MTIHDISLTLSPSLPVWPGMREIVIEHFAAMDDDALFSMTNLRTSVHAGTHVDAPYHFLQDGCTVESLPLEVLTGPCYVIQLPDGVDAITAEVLERTEITPGMKRILFGTGNSHYWARGETKFQEGFVAITEDGAEWLVDRGSSLSVWITCPSLPSGTPSPPTGCFSRPVWSSWRD